jgi:hypothetical protein
MSRPHAAGTRFRLFPQFDEGLPAETVIVSSPPGSLTAGPGDERMYVANALRKSDPYAPPLYMPPYDAPVHPAAEPDPHGHFDHLPEHLPQFRAAHLFGTVRLVLDIFEHAMGERIAWWHPHAPVRVELVPVVHWQNAQSGPGFLETGLWPDDDGVLQPFCLNFDVIAHEVGHEMLFARLGLPRGAIDSQFLAFHEFFGDMVALLGALHFSSVRARLLEQTAGNLYALNLVNRLAETAPHNQIRLASNDVTMDDVAGLRLLPSGDWFDPQGLGRNAHHLSLPLLGAAFDVLVEIFQEALAALGALPPALDARGWSVRATRHALPRLQAAQARRLARFAAPFERALLDARDALLAGLVHALATLQAEEVDFALVAARLLEAMIGVRAALFGRLVQCFLDRGIDPRPHLATVPGAHDWRVRPSRRRAPLQAAAPVPACPCHDPALRAGARRLMPHLHRAA